MSESSKAVFLSYASQDAEAAKRICDALRGAGVEVWFDQSELRGGDAWDQKIRRQIRECALFVPVISSNTDARAEGYFRREWKLAVERTVDMADDEPFLFPIVLGDLPDATARVPERFREVQWTRLRSASYGGQGRAEGEDPALTELAARVAKVLQGNVGRDRRIPPSTREAGYGDPALQRKSAFEKWWWLVFPVVGMSVPIIGLLKDRGPAERPSRNAPAAISPDPKSPTPDPGAQTPIPKPSEARQLAERAFALSVDRYDSGPDDYAAADELIRRALELDPNDGEILARAAQLQLMHRNRGFDFSPERIATGRQQAERAIRLAPDSTEALCALAMAQRYTRNLDAMEETLRRVLALDPHHARALLGLSGSLFARGQTEEGEILRERARQQPKWAPLADYQDFLRHFNVRQFDRAEMFVRRSHAAKPTANSAAGIAILQLTGKGDLAEAARVLEALPPADRNLPRVVLVTTRVHLGRRAPDEALRALDRLADEFVQDSWFTGPKNLLAGRAHAMAGRESAARIAWEEALGIVDARLKQEPGDPTLRRCRGEILAWLGRTDEALAEARSVAEINRGPFTQWDLSEVTIYAILGRADLAAPLMELQLSKPSNWPLTPVLLRLDPLWDRVRDHEMVRALLAAAPPRAWPRDPELVRAIGFVEHYESIPDDFDLAEQLARRALERAPADIEAVTVMARVQGMYLLRGFDRSKERLALAQRYAERAVQLAPDEPEALYALAIYLRAAGTDPARAERLVRRAVELDPANPRAARLLVNRVFELGRRDEAVALAEMHARLFPRDPLSHYDLALLYRNVGRYEDFERELDGTLALAPIPNAMVWKARARFGLHHDFAGMREWLDRVPERVRGVERTVFSRFLHAAMSNQPGQGLEALRGFPRRWFVDFEYTGPTALLEGELLSLQGKRELAKRQYEAALFEAERQQADDPANRGVVVAEFWSLLGLGRTEEARLALRRLLEATGRPYWQSRLSTWWFTMIPAALLGGERETALELLRESVATAPDSREGLRRRLQFDPRMAPFRDDPAIVAVLSEAPKP